MAPPRALVAIAGVFAAFVCAVTAVHQVLLARHRVHRERWVYSLLSLVPLIIVVSCVAHIVTYDGAPVVSKGWSVSRNLTEACGLLLFHSLLVRRIGGGATLIAALGGEQRKYFAPCVAPCNLCAHCCSSSGPFTERSLKKCWMMSVLYVVVSLLAVVFVAGCELAAIARGERCAEGCVPQLLVLWNTAATSVGAALSLHGIAVVYAAARPLLSKHSRLGRKFIAIKSIVIIATVQEIAVKAVQARGGRLGHNYSPTFNAVYLENVLLAFEMVPLVLLTTWA